MLIDFPYDTSAHCINFGMELGEIGNVLITHSHSDHYVPIMLGVRGGVFAHNMKYEKINFYGPADLKEICDKEEIGEKIRENIALKDIDKSISKNIDLKHDITIHIAPREEIAVFARTMKALNKYIEQEENTGGVRGLLDAFGKNPKGNGDYIYTSFNLD
jgi:ribonuclease BN (tRNA processing enzyme)